MLSAVSPVMTGRSFIILVGEHPYHCSCLYTTETVSRYYRIKRFHHTVRHRQHTAHDIGPGSERDPCVAAVPPYEIIGQRSIGQHLSRHTAVMPEYAVAHDQFHTCSLSRLYQSGYYRQIGKERAIAGRRKECIGQRQSLKLYRHVTALFNHRLTSVGSQAELVIAVGSTRHARPAQDRIALHAAVQEHHSVGMTGNEQRIGPGVERAVNEHGIARTFTQRKFTVTERTVDIQGPGTVSSSVGKDWRHGRKTAQNGRNHPRMCVYFHYLYKCRPFFSNFAVRKSKMETIATIRTGFTTKFGIPRQSGLVPSLKGTIVFNPEYRNADALRGLEGFSHIWIIWQFSESIREQWSPTVRPPRLGGNTRLGVFATRSPFRPNPIGLSCVRLESIETDTPDGPVLHVSGADLMDGTPIYDIKPYIPYTDCQPQATGGFTDSVGMHRLNVSIPPECADGIEPSLLQTIQAILAEDPRPRYQNDPERVYGFVYDDYEIKFKVTEDPALTVTSITRIK